LLPINDLQNLNTFAAIVAIAIIAAIAATDTISITATSELVISSYQGMIEG
jgi:hypothetical protein